MTDAASEAGTPGAPAPAWLSGPSYVGRWRLDETVDEPPPAGHGPLVSAGLTIGILLLAIQLWLLTIALDLFLSGRGAQVWSLAVVSGFIFLGGLGMLWTLHRRPRVARPWLAPDRQAPAVAAAPPADRAG